MSIFKNRAAKNLLLAILCSSIGVGVHILAMGQLLFELTGSITAMATILSFQGLGAICVLPFAGPLVDHLDAKKVYLACDLSRAATMAIIILLAASRIDGMVLLITVAAIFLALIDNVHRSALFKFTGLNIPDELQGELNAKIGVMFQIGVLSGMALLGIILYRSSPIYALIFDVLGSLISAWIMARQPSVSAAPRDNAAQTGWRPGALLQQVLHGWLHLLRQAAKQSTVLVMLALCSADFILSYSLNVLVVPLVAKYYAGASWPISAMEGTMAIGMIAASFFTRRTLAQKMLPIWLFLQAASTLLLSLATTPLWHFAAFFIIGFASLNSITWLLTALQRQASESDKGKMASLRLLSIGLGTALSMPLVSNMSRISFSLALQGCALIMMCFFMLSLWVAYRFQPIHA
ncbi:MFS transporter [Chromobacterium violaceum]|uniref:MFS transporter n=1 Tax=Chromobacterium violaceum TaxID=536 RepID=UPI001E328DBA|nr:MFS transporter [Chromobacterium violaceum]MCD0494893.1 MFS transporter [Chromobacterium violaceum]